MQGPTTQVVEVEENGDVSTWKVAFDTFTSVLESFRQGLVSFLKMRHRDPKRV